MKTRRERVRDAAIEDIKSIAWELAHKRGIEGVTVNGITRRMGMTPPAFYRYFKNREELIQALVIDTYQSYGSELITARDSIFSDDPVGQLYNVYIASRQWAIENPNLFLLFVGNPAFGYKEPGQDILAAADRIRSLYIDLYEEIWKKGLIHYQSDFPDLPGDYKNQIDQIYKSRDLTMPRYVFNLVIRNSMLVYGAISYELSNRYSDMTGDQLLFYQFQIRDILRISRIDYF